MDSGDTMVCRVTTCWRCLFQCTLPALMRCARCVGCWCLAASVPRAQRATRVACASPPSHTPLFCSSPRAWVAQFAEPLGAPPQTYHPHLALSLYFSHQACASSRAPTRTGALSDDCTAPLLTPPGLFVSASLL
ncbi:hypothetical protein TRVL_08468 [Trypanosoma vivax]|nr:hypothetical protein TRVL_08468 [Trypanosoma vivax]